MAVDHDSGTANRNQLESIQVLPVSWNLFQWKQRKPPEPNFKLPSHLEEPLEDERNHNETWILPHRRFLSPMRHLLHWKIEYFKIYLVNRENGTINYVFTCAEGWSCPLELPPAFPASPTKWWIEGDILPEQWGRTLRTEDVHPTNEASNLETSNCWFHTAEA